VRFGLFDALFADAGGLGGGGREGEEQAGDEWCVGRLNLGSTDRGIP